MALFLEFFSTALLSDSYFIVWTSFSFFLTALIVNRKVTLQKQNVAKCLPEEVKFLWVEMADRSAKILPGQLYIEVEYDYEYEAKDKKIVIKQGEKYILVKKTNDDWWQVKRDENSKPFYVPAQYVKEIPRKALMPPVKQAGMLPNNALKLTHGLQRSTENVNKSPELSSFGKSSPVQVSCLVRDANQNLGPNNSPGQTLGLSLDLTQNNGKLNNELQSPKVSNQFRTISMGHFPCPEFLEIEKTSFLHEQSCDSAGEGSEKIHQDSESGDELSSSSTEQAQVSLKNTFCTFVGFFFLSFFFVFNSSFSLLPKLFALSLLFSSFFPNKQRL